MSISLPNPAHFNSSQSDQFLQYVADDLKTYLSDPSFLVHLRNATQFPDVIRALADADLITIAEGGTNEIDQEELEKINHRMQGWTIDKVDGGCSGEQVFVFHLSKGDNSRLVVLAANDLGGWLAK